MEFSTGNILTLIIFFVGLIAQWIVHDRRVTRLEERVKANEKGQVKLESDILIRLEKMEEKIDRLIERQFK